MNSKSINRKDRRGIAQSPLRNGLYNTDSACFAEALSAMQFNKIINPIKLKSEKLYPMRDGILAGTVYR